MVHPALPGLTSSTAVYGCEIFNDATEYAKKLLGSFITIIIMI